MAAIWSVETGSDRRLRHFEKSFCPQVFSQYSLNGFIHIAPVTLITAAGQDEAYAQVEILRRGGRHDP